MATMTMATIRITDAAIKHRINVFIVVASVVVPVLVVGESHVEWERSGSRASADEALEGHELRLFFLIFEDERDKGIISLSLDIILQSTGPILTLGFLYKCVLLNTKCISVSQLCESFVFFLLWTDFFHRRKKIIG